MKAESDDNKRRCALLLIVALRKRQGYVDGWQSVETVSKDIN